MTLANELLFLARWWDLTCRMTTLSAKDDIFWKQQLLANLSAKPIWLFPSTSLQAHSNVGQTYVKLHQVSWFLYFVESKFLLGQFSFSLIFFSILPFLYFNSVPMLCSILSGISNAAKLSYNGSAWVLILNSCIVVTWLSANLAFFVDFDNWKTVVRNS